MALGAELKRLGKHSAIYGLGGLVSRILAVLLLPLYTRYLSPSDYGVVETLIALTTVIGIALSAGIGSAFFRFYFDANEPAARRRVLRTSFWFIMGDGDARPRRRRRVRERALAVPLRDHQGLRSSSPPRSSVSGLG